MNRLLKSILAALSLSIITFSVSHSQQTMVVSTWLPPHHIMNSIVWPEFVKRIESVTDGRVTGKIETGLASPPAQIELIEDGGADAAWIFHGYNPGRFVTTKLIEVPGLVGSSSAASAAHWRAHEKYLSKANEHDGVVPVAMMVHAPGTLHLSKEISSLDEVSGLKIRSGGGVMGDVLTTLDAAKVQVPAPKVYETVANGVADGTFFPGDTIAILKLTEVLPYTYQVDGGGFYRGSFSIVMSEEFLDSLSSKDRKAVLAVLGEDFSAFAGKAWDKGNEQGISAQRKTGSVINLTGSSASKFTNSIDKIRSNVLSEVSAKGVDAKSALRLIEKTMSEYK